MGIAKKHSELFAGAGMRNMIPLLLAVGSATLGAIGESEGGGRVNES